MLPRKNLAFLSVGGNFEFLGGIPPPIPPPLNTLCMLVLCENDVCGDVKLSLYPFLVS